MDNDLKELLDLIEKARENGICIKSAYGAIYFTPDELTACINAGRFCWGEISNWSAVKLPAHLTTYTGKTVMDLYGEEPDTLLYWKNKAKMLESK